MKRRAWVGQAGMGLLGATYLADVAAPKTKRAEGLSASWIHGTAFQLEDPTAVNDMRRVGWGTSFNGRPGAFTWFHVAIPTPVLVDGNRPKLERVSVLYRADNAEIRNIHIYDGPKRIKTFDGLNAKGDHSGGVSAQNTWELPPGLPFLYSIGISVGVQFSIGFDTAITTEMLFSSAGADFRFNDVRAITTIAPL